MTTTNAQIEQLLNDLDCTWEHVDALALGSIDLIASITNQSRFEPIDQPTVDRYVAALADGATFPPVIVRRIPPVSTKHKAQLIIAGGNHRARAHLDAGHKTIPAYVVTCNDLVALEIAYADNATHGLPPTTSERLTHALALIERGRTIAAAARTVGIDPPRLYQHIDTAKAAKRAANLGLTEQFSRIGITIQHRCAAIRDDRILSRVIRTITDERMGQLASQQMITSVNAAPTIAKAMDAIDLHIRDWHNRPGTRQAARGASAHTTLLVNLGITQHLKPADVIAGAVTAREREQLHQALVAGARHLMAIDRHLQADDKPDLKVVG